MWTAIRRRFGTFGVSLARLGIAITNALVSGVVVFLGSFWPIIVGGDKRTGGICSG